MGRALAVKLSGIFLDRKKIIFILNESFVCDSKKINTSQVNIQYAAKKNSNSSVRIGAKVPIKKAHEKRGSGIRYRIRFRKEKKVHV